MKTITIITPANIEVEYRLAGVGSRLSAFIIDFTIQTLTILLITLLVWGMSSTFWDGEMGGTALSVIIAAGFVIHFGYFIICELVMNGQTIGKRTLGLRAIRENGQPIGFPQALVRGLVRSSADIIYIGLFVIAFHPQHKRLGDIAAGTVVICEKYSNTFELSLAAHEWPHFLPRPAEVTDEERHVVEEWLRRRDDMLDGGGKIAQKLAEYFTAKAEIQEYQTAEEVYSESTVD